ncbi:MAG: ACP S-malonyltransferase [Sebaldella sp.]|nr:ACP S-malonyltransferase [Sebaldella sp.]
MGKIAFVYPGQGSQQVGMGSDLYENTEIKAMFDKIFNVIENKNLKEVMFNGPEEELKDTKNAQPSISLLSVILTKLVRDKGITPDYVAGHSLGEYTALYGSEVLNDEDIMKLVTKRGAIMSSAGISGTMAAILGLDSSSVEEICAGIDGVIEAVNYNDPKQTVIAGDKDVIEGNLKVFKEKGARRAMLLPVSGPFHSSLMKPVAPKIKEEFSKLTWNNPKVPLIANTTAKELTNVEEIQEELFNQTFGPVKWVEIINKLTENGVTKIYEIGPGSVLKGMIKKINGDIEVVNISKIEDLNNL